jgi:hypothetical protein
MDKDQSKSGDCRCSGKANLEASSRVIPSNLREGAVARLGSFLSAKTSAVAKAFLGTNPPARPPSLRVPHLFHPSGTTPHARMFGCGLTLLFLCPFPRPSGPFTDGFIDQSFRMVGSPRRLLQASLTAATIPCARRQNACTEAACLTRRPSKHSSYTLWASPDVPCTCRRRWLPPGGVLPIVTWSRS